MNRQIYYLAGDYNALLFQKCSQKKIDSAKVHEIIGQHLRLNHCCKKILNEYKKTTQNMKTLFKVTNELLHFYSFRKESVSTLIESKTFSCQFNREKKQQMKI
jgi:hypothetical protein